jgi:Na+/proline symporter/signal transduction histidine kinase
MSWWWIVGAILVYFYLIFQVAHWAERGRARPLSAGVYTLALAVYCTSWTYYGGIGRAAGAGIAFFAVYIGPIFVFWFAQGFLRKLLRVCQSQRITSISDFLAARYGKSPGLAALAAFIALLSLVPYIALQLKAVSDSLLVLGEFPNAHSLMVVGPFWQDPTFWIALLLSLFVIGFGTRRADASEQHRGIISAVAIESLVKLGVFLLCGFIMWQEAGGMAGLALRIAAHPELSGIWSSAPLKSADFWWIALLSGLVIFCLPRQFQVMVVENSNPAHLRSSRWLFPLYLIVINLWVIPLALLGKLTFPGDLYQGDMFMLALPLTFGHQALSMAVFFGGLSAATAMIVVETMALGTMVANDLLMPWLIGRHLMQRGTPRDVARWVKPVRRMTIVALLLFSYIFIRLVGNQNTLAGIGLMSFVAVAQFAPALLGGLYWRRGHWRGAAWGLVIGFLLWGYTLLYPALAQSGLLDAGWLVHGPRWLQPATLFGTELGLVAHSTVVSLLVNTLVYVLVSYYSQAKPLDLYQAALFVDEQRLQTGVTLKSNFNNEQLLEELRQFIEPERLQQALLRLEQQRGSPVDMRALPDREMQIWAETCLAGALGAAMARVVLVATLRNEDIGQTVTMGMLSEASHAIQSNWEAMRTTLDNVEQGVCMFDANRQLLVWNKRVFELLSLPLELACVGMPQARFVECQGGQIVRPGSGSAQMANGKIIEWHWRVLAGGGMVGTFTDITAQKEAESVLERKVAERTSEVTLQKQAVEQEHENVRRAHRNISLLSEIGREITASLDHETIMHSVFRHVDQLMEADAFGIGLLDEVHGVLDFPFNMERGQRSARYTRSMADPNQFAVWCVQHRTEVLVNDIEVDYAKYIDKSGMDRIGPTDQSGGPVGSLLFVPLLLKGKVLGLIAVRSSKKQGYQTIHLDMMITLAAYTAVALDNADAYLRLQSLQEKLLAQEKMAALGYLVGGIAHELNTPIGNSLLMASSLHEMSSTFGEQIEEGKVRRSDLSTFSSDATEAAGMIMSNLRRAADLVNSFKELAVSQQGAERMRFNLQQVSLDIVASMMEAIELERHLITLDIPDTLELDSYPRAFGDVLVHLINNALLHAFVGRRGGKMTISARQILPGKLQIQFADDGNGIEAEHLRRIFDPFFTTRLGSGRNGLGLHIVYNLVSSLLGGHISVQSTLGSGTVFTIELPTRV